MKKAAILIMISVLCLSMLGCTIMPAPPEEAVPADGAEAAPAAPAAQPPAEPAQTPAAEEVIEQVVQTQEPAYVPAQPETQNLTNTTEEKILKISGSLTLQPNIDLCPHLIDKFDCNKYDIRRCGFKTLVGKNDYYPDIISCRSGYDYRKEDPNHKYCLIQECRALEKDNIVYAYGGPAIYAEYAYSVESVAGGIMTHYTLLKCGEESKEFKTSNECRFYKSDLKNV